MLRIIISMKMRALCVSPTSFTHITPFYLHTKFKLSLYSPFDNLCFFVEDCRQSACFHAIPPFVSMIYGLSHHDLCRGMQQYIASTHTSARNNIRYLNSIHALASFFRNHKQLVFFTSILVLLYFQESHKGLSWDLACSYFI